VGSTAAFVGVSLPEPPGPEIIPAPEGSMPWFIMGVWCSSLAATGASPRAEAWPTVPCPVRRALGATTLAMAARMSRSWAAFPLWNLRTIPAHVFSRWPTLPRAKSPASGAVPAVWETPMLQPSPGADRRRDKFCVD